MHFKLISFLLFIGLDSFSFSVKAGNDLAENFTLFDIQTDKIVQLSDYRGKVIYLDFWASWCASCAEALPLFSQWQSEFGENFIVISINVDEEKSDGIQMAKNLALTYPVAYDTNLEIAALYQVKALPTSYIIDKNGQIVYRHLGFNKEDSVKLVEVINSLL